MFAAGADGGVRVAGDLPVSGEGAFYELTLRLTDGAAIAERLLFLRLTPPPPEIEGELSGETKLVNALSGSGTALLAVTVSNGGALLPIADANGFASGGGAVAVISLARPATALFTLDNLTLSLALTATNAGGTVSETVSFASSARGFDGLELSLHLTTALLRSGTELFAAADANLTIWHNDGKEENYELSGLDSELFAAGADGGVRVASDLPVSGEGAFYELTLRLTDGAAIAERLLFLRLTPPLPEIEGELLGETKLVDALSGSGTALLAVTVSNGGALSPFADANGFASEGGAVAVISLARSATALFTLDGLTLSLALTVTNAGGTVSETVSFASSARGFDGLELSLHLTTALLHSATELFAAADSRLTIWHNDGKEENYKLSGLDSELFATDAGGGVRVASDLPVSGEGAFYELTLRLTDGAAIAERLLFLRLTPPPPEIEGVSGETKLVDALSGSGTALLAVTVSNGGALSPFADANGFASDGGAVAVISLARSATALFTRDGLTLSLALTATNAGGTVSATVSFASSALGINGAGLFVSFATAMLPSETEVFAAADARLTIWHNDNAQETYELSGANANLFAVDVNGGVRTASDLSSSEDDLLYELILRLTDGAAVAERLLTLALLPPPIAVDVEVECAGQWPCRDQFAAALSAAIESGEATLDHGQAVVIDLEGGTHGSEVHSVFQLYGIGASVSLTLAEDEDLPRGGYILHTPDAFLELPAKKKQIVAHSVADLIAPAETLEEKDAIVAQAAANLYHPFPSFYRTTRRPDAPALITAAVETGLMVVVGGIAKTSERYELNSGYTEIDFDKRYTYKDYCDGTRKHKGTGGPPNVITLNGEEYCSVFDRCGWMQNYCLVAPAIDVVITETGQREEGTSYAAPQAAAALQMLSTMWPELSQRELALMLLELADDVGEQDHEGRDLGGIDHVYGHGVLSFRRLYEPGGLSPFIVGDEIFRFSCDADANTCQKSPIENVDSENEENKQPPEIIKADSDSPLSSQKPVLAAAESGTALLTVTVSNGELSPFSDANGFASDGGAVAVISLARSAAALFTLDGLTLSLALTATSAGGTVSETVSFVSSALGIDGAGLFVSFATVMLPSETEVFAAADAGLTIWHNDNAQETYELSGADASLFAVDVNGGVRTASDLSSSEDDLLYELTLRLTDGAAVAERLLTLALLPPPIAVDVEVECTGQWPCRDQFAAALSAAIESGEATLDHGQAVVIDLEGGTHGSRVRSAFQLYGSGASVSLTLAEKDSTPDAFLELPAKKKQIVVHSILDLLALAETLEEKDAIVAQATGNFYQSNPRFQYTGNLFNPNVLNNMLVTAAVETGLMVVVGGIAKTSERYELNSGYPEIDFDKRYTYKDYCDGTRQSSSAPPPNTVTIDGEEYCSIYDRCGWMQNYCLVAPAKNVVIDAETGQREEGASFAAPQAAAALQMLGTMWPELSQRELALMLLELADDVGEPGIDDVYGHGALSFRRLYAPGGLSSFIVGDEIFRFSCDADANTCQKSPIENVDSENEENKQPPEIIKADSDSPLSSQKPVLAAAESGTALLTVTVSNGELSPFADANGFASGGGAVAVISLARSATALFTLDGLALSLALTATNAGGTVSATVSFASSARGFDGLELSLHLTTALLRSATELFAATDSRLTIWHNDGKEESYELSGLDSELFVAGADGEVRVASDLPVSGEGAFYELTLRLTDGAATAERLLFLRLTPPLPEIEGVLSSETKLVNALSGSGTALLAVTVSNGGVLLSFADANGFASEGGAVAVISLARPATALFTLDGLTLSLALTATNAGGTVSATASFASSALGINGAGLFASFATVMLPSETEVFAAADARLTIWHNGNKQETYELSGSDASLFAVDANGGVRTASDLSSEDDLLYELTLRLTDGAAIAERLLTLALLPPPIAVDVEVECTGQWPCRDQFAAALSAAIESGEATLDHGQAVVIDLDNGNTHGSEVRSAFQLYGSGASVSLTLAEKESLPRGESILHTPDAFLELPSKKKRIVAHSVNDLIASAETLEEKDAIVAQAAANFYEPFANFYRTFRRPDAPALITAAVETGLMVVVGGIAKTSERYELNRGYTEIDFDKRYTYKDYCDGTRKATSGSPPNIITLNGEEYCSIYNRCGWMQNYCLVAPAMDVVIDAETGQRVDGTSYAAPQAAAALQMLGTMWPELSQRELALMLLELADDVGEPGIDDVYGHGALSFRRLYAPGGLSPFIVGDEIFRFSCDADSNTCQKSPIENVDLENEENKQPPEIIKADSDSPLSPQKPVLAAAESGTALLTVTVSNGALSPFADANGFASEGGAVAVISLARSATALFTLDNLTLSLALTATNAGGDGVGDGVVCVVGVGD